MKHTTLRIRAPGSTSWQGPDLLHRFTQGVRSTKPGFCCFGPGFLGQCVFAEFEAA